MIWVSQHSLMASWDYSKATLLPRPFFQMLVAFFLLPSVSSEKAGFQPQLSIWIKSYTNSCSLNGGRRYQLSWENKNSSAPIWSQQAKPEKVYTAREEYICWRQHVCELLDTTGWLTRHVEKNEVGTYESYKTDTLDSWNPKLCIFWGGRSFYFIYFYKYFLFLFFIFLYFHSSKKLWVVYMVPSLES